jgi:hypothetical protein
MQSTTRQYKQNDHLELETLLDELAKSDTLL